MSHFIKEIQPYFSDISSSCLWIISLLLCFPSPVELLGKGKRKWFLGAICCLLFGLGLIGSKESRNEISDLKNAIDNLPTKQDVTSLFENSQSKPIQAKDFAVSINGQRIKFYRDFVTSVHFDPQKEVDLLIMMQNNSDQTMDMLHIDFAVSGCRIIQQNNGWIPSVYPSSGTRDAGVSYSSQPGEWLNPGTSASLPVIKLSCTQDLPKIGCLVSLSAKNVKPLQYEFALVKNRP